MRRYYPFFYDVENGNLDKMIEAVGLEMKWAPDVLGALFAKGTGIKSISYWYKLITKK